ncbi:putative dynein regulatory complex protein 1 [Lucilia cuprina]|uniref:Putative dynein regulatory complex protein 1 n=1 Tax=Lucilia cuprina TaxID=7375 RepID=A0A0L0C5M1_LUCCU|nr:Dynein regulatory complex protein 1 like protein [Lucilia cuprina]KNC27536.1 putative dynein regulatory complex protein 1 [Lucilia cuprina]
MEVNTTEEKEENKDCEIPTEKNVWKELLSQTRNRSSKFDNRTQLVFDALREKLKKTTQTKDKTDIEIQLENSELHLEELIQFGNELVNNIKSANEQQELLQSQEKHAKDMELQANLRQEAEISLGQFEDINKKWLEMNNLKEPMAIYENMQKQRENISNLMASKDELIEQCQQELKRINQKYYFDQDKQSQDICFLVERIDQQIELLKRTYRTSIYDLQNTIDKEKQKILSVAQEKWNTVYEHLMVNEAQKMELVKEKQKFYEKELDNIRNKQEEITRNTRIRLEKDAEILELEIRKTRVNILMNSEKIDYNYQVLQKRNEENIIINNQQKRRVAKFNESIVVLKKKLTELKENNRLAMERLTLDIQKLHASINDLQIKAEHFRKNNRTKLAKVWNINFKEIKHLVTRVFEIDRILYEQQLARKWFPPDIDLDQYDYVKETQNYRKPNKMVMKQSQTIKPSTLLSCHKQLHDILHKISDRAGFLVEERLLEILKPYTDNEKCLVRIESIFSALNITDITVVESLVKYFEPYSWCPNCSSGLPVGSFKTLYSFKRHSEDETEEENNYQDKKSTNNLCTNHILCMEPTLVLTALNEFISKQVNMVGKSVDTRKLNKNPEVDLLQFDKSQITSYWQQFSSYMSKDQQNIWKSIEHGLNHYLEVLKKRQQMDNECVFLQKQNAELKHLLQKL